AARAGYVPSPARRPVPRRELRGTPPRPPTRPSRAGLPWTRCGGRATASGRRAHRRGRRATCPGSPARRKGGRRSGSTPRVGRTSSLYDGSLTTGRSEVSVDSRTAEFVARGQEGGQVEATDWLPDEYRQKLVKFIEMHANSELMGVLPERECILKAPTLQRKLAL